MDGSALAAGSDIRVEGQGFAPTALSGASPKFNWGGSNLGEACAMEKKNALRVRSPRSGLDFPCIEISTKRATIIMIN